MKKRLLLSISTVTGIVILAASYHIYGSKTDYFAHVLLEMGVIFLTLVPITILALQIESLHEELRKARERLHASERIKSFYELVVVEPKELQYWSDRLSASLSKIGECITPADISQSLLFIRNELDSPKFAPIIRLGQLDKWIVFHQPPDGQIGLDVTLEDIDGKQLTHFTLKSDDASIDRPILEFLKSKSGVPAIDCCMAIKESFIKTLDFVKTAQLPAGFVEFVADSWILTTDALVIKYVGGEDYRIMYSEMFGTDWIKELGTKPWFKEDLFLLSKARAKRIMKLVENEK